MSDEVSTPSNEGAGTAGPKPRSHTITARGEPMMWLTGGALVLCVLMVVGLLAWIAWRGFPTFWPKPLTEVALSDGSRVLGEITREEQFEVSDEELASIVDPEARSRAESEVQEHGSLRRRLFHSGNAELFGGRFQWVADYAIVGEERRPEWAVTVERLEDGSFFGYPKAFAVCYPVPSAWPDAVNSSASTDLLPGPSDTSAAERDRWVTEALRALRPGEGAVKGLQVRRRIKTGLVDRLVLPDDLQETDQVEAVAEIWFGEQRSWSEFQARHEDQRREFEELRDLQRGPIGEVADEIEELRLELRSAARAAAVDPAWLTAYEVLAESRARGVVADTREAEQQLQRIEAATGKPSADFLGELAAIEREDARLRKDLAMLSRQDQALRVELSRYVMQFATTRDQDEAQLELAEIVRAYRANALDSGDSRSIYLDRWGEFLTAEPRESNREGGVFPAIFGTVMMSLFMCLVVVPFGVLAALYLREYAKAGPIVSLIRIAVNNLAGVPSIVFGVFGLGFFCYIVGRGIDEVLYSSKLPTPTFGTGGLFWASLTLALLTAPVVIVATEEALAAVPNSMREGSYACGASKWQTIRRIVLPRALPGIMTGAILAMARGAGEVAPLMLVGAVKVAPELPIAAAPPFGLDRSFMHLGYHIFDLGFKSPDSEAAKPMVFTTTLLLISIIAILNLLAVWLRSRLRKKFASGAF